MRQLFIVSIRCGGHCVITNFLAFGMKSSLPFCTVCFDWPRSRANLQSSALLVILVGFTLATVLSLVFFGEIVRSLGF